MKKISTILAIVGLFLAICVGDETSYELLWRLLGVAIFIGGGVFAGWIELEERKEKKQ